MLHLISITVVLYHALNVWSHRFFISCSTFTKHSNQLCEPVLFDGLTYLANLELIYLKTQHDESMKIGNKYLKALWFSLPKHETTPPGNIYLLTQQILTPAAYATIVDFCLNHFPNVNLIILVRK